MRSLIILLTALLAVIPSIAPAETFRVSVIDDRFSPSGRDAGEEVVINVGDTVVWTLKSANSHNIEDGDFENHDCAGEGLMHTFLKKGEKFSHTFNRPILCYYRCNVHPPDMFGLIKVIGGETPADTPKEK